MRNIKITVEYDGANYSGWQRQKDATTVQEKIEEAIFKITGEKTALHGSGRTDAGVHAIGQTANFRTESGIDIKIFPKAFNSVLPEDITVKSAEEADEDFHSRASAKKKTYFYKILNRPFPSPLNRKTCWFIPGDLDTERMKAACPLLVGERDFAVFAHSNANVKTTVRRVFKAEIGKDGDFIIFTIQANGFLKRMVRLIVGTLVQVGGGKLKIGDFEKIIKSGKKTPKVVAAPPQGLFLESVEY